jgi:moderate conductance mechanosensitive channel
MEQAVYFDLPDFSAPIVGWVNTLLPRLPKVILILLVGILLIRLMTRSLKFIFSITIAHAALRNVLVSIIEIILWILLTVNLLTELGFKDMIVFFTGSIAAVGLAMAAGGSTLVADIIAGIFLAQDPDFDVGDEVIVGETPTQGVVESMDARRTRIRDKDGVLHIIPNSIVERKEWVLVRKSHDQTALARVVNTANKRIRRAATETRVVVEKKTLVTRKRLAVRKNAQSQPKVAPTTIRE